MVRRIPAMLPFVPLEHRKIDDPQESQIFRVQKLMTVVIFLPRRQPELPGRDQNRFFGALALGLARPSGEQEQILLGGAGTLANFGHSVRKIALQALGIVVNPQAALGAEGFQVVALLAADDAGLGNANRDQRQPLRRKILALEQILDAME